MMYGSDLTKLLKKFIFIAHSKHQMGRTLPITMKTTKHNKQTQEQANHSTHISDTRSPYFIYLTMLFYSRLHLITHGCFILGNYSARTRPGTDFPTWLEKLLSQTHGQRAGLISTVDFPRRVTVREVLKYSLT